MYGILWRLIPVPVAGTLQISLMQGNAAVHGIQIREKTAISGGIKAFPESIKRILRGDGLTGVYLLAYQQTYHSQLDIWRSMALDFAETAHQSQHAVGNVLTLFKLALSNGAFRALLRRPCPEQQLRRAAGYCREDHPSCSMRRSLCHRS